GNNPQFAAFLGTARVNTFQNRVSASQVLFAGFRVIDGIKMANVNLDMAQEGYRQSRQEVVSNVSTAYYNALKAYQLVQVNKAGLKQAQSQLDQSKKLEKAGVGIKLDVIRSQNRLVNVQMQLSQALNSFEKSKKALNLSMGRSIDYSFELNIEAKVPEIPLSEDQVIQEALKNRSELRQLNLKKEIDEIFTTIQSRGNWPTVSAILNYNLNDNSVVNGNSVNNQNLNYGLNMSWPVFDGLLTLAKVQKAQNTLIQDQISIDQLQQSVILEVKQTLLDIQEAKERLIMAKDSVSLAEESFKIAQIRYENGVGISLDLLDAQTSLLQAKSNLVNTEFDLNISRIKLYKAMGIDI
ncbi:MAG: TolC family protein, partial [Candidatus Sericytochromatia bacterium]